MYHVLRNLLSDVGVEVMVQGQRSAKVDLELGAPQGDTLSPLLYAFFANDLLETVYSECAGIRIPKEAGSTASEDDKLVAIMFADDYVGLADSPEELQVMIDVLHRHSKKWRYKANVAKYAVLEYGPAKKKQPPPASGFPYVWGDRAVPVVEKYKYLGVVLNRTGSWEDHATFVREKADKIVGMWTGLLSDRRVPVEVKKIIILGAINPTLNYASSAWHATQKVADLLETAQNDAARKVLRCPSNTPTAALRMELGIRPLTTIRTQEALILLHKIHNMEEDRLPAKLARAAWGKKQGNTTKSWKEETMTAAADLKADISQITRKSTKKLRQHIKEKSALHLASEIKREAEGSPSVAYYIGTAPERNVWDGTVPRHLGNGLRLNKGLELHFQCRARSLPVREKTSKYQRNKAYDSTYELCPACQQSVESIEHLVLGCEQYARQRDPLNDLLLQALCEESQTSYSNATNEAQLECLLTEKHQWVRLEWRQTLLEGVAAMLYAIWDRRAAMIKEQQGLAPAAAKKPRRV
jgi:hypothetical protein